ncbi:AIG1-type guanine nucleotide-binding (G) domain [Dillenia turbinata]|uniref:AIG1-type guanine nucleotide-binding (G) domain n=1 Tax=Dillenia turbinata TaxID=194707 RepID=A0AAN8W5I7_9MAGN
MTTWVCVGSMKAMKDWALTQLVSKSLASSRPLSGSDGFFNNETPREEFNDQGTTQSTNLEEASARAESPTDGYRGTQLQSMVQVPVEDFDQSHQSTYSGKLDSLAKIENLQIKFFRLLQRLRMTQGNLLVTKVLYRLHLATLVRAGESDLKRAHLIIDRSRKIATDQEAAGLCELDFSFKILILGRTGAGKSATINSIFDQTRVVTNAFQPATECIREVVGTVNGIKITFIDTPGLLPSSPSNLKRNRKILLSVKRYIRRSPPDMVFYFERLDLINMGYSDFPLLKLVTEVFGSAIWFNTILVMTHASPALPEGPNGYPVTYESYVYKCSNVVQHYIQHAVLDSRLENPVLLVENHPHCNKNVLGEKILPNGVVWKPELLLLCVCSKVLSDANRLLDFKDSIELGPASTSRLPSLPHLLSTVLRHRSVSNPRGEDNEIDELSLSNIEKEDEYDKLPPIRILSKSQFEKLTNAQKEDYLDELEYRETLYMKKQLKEEYLRRKGKKSSPDGSVVENEGNENQEEVPEPVLLPDMAVPPSFDSDWPLHRYRCLVSSDECLVRPVLDPQGWDHDVGFDGINVETAGEVGKNIYASISGQMSKDKQGFSIHSESAAIYKDPRGPTYCIGLDVQSSGKDLIYTLHGDTKLRSLKHNIPGCGVSMISLRNNNYFAAKIEDTISIGKRMKIFMNAGRMEGAGQVAYGGSVETTLRGKDCPVRNDQVTLSMTMLSFEKETVIGGGIQTDFRPCRGTKMSLNANLNNRKMGQISLKTSSSEHVEIAAIAFFSVLRAILHRRANKDLVEQSPENEKVQ